MLLYHGTHSGHLEAIDREGLRPRKGRDRGNWSSARVLDRDQPERVLTSKSGLVYLTDCAAFFYAENAAAETGYQHRAVVVEVDTDRLDKDRFVPDEDYLAQLIWMSREVIDYKGVLDLSACKTIDDVHRRIDPRRVSYFWEESLLNVGCCAYAGPVPREALTRWTLFDQSMIRLEKEVKDVFKFQPAGKEMAKAFRDIQNRLFEGHLGACDPRWFETEELGL
jgi:hypothetical protein